MLISYFWKSHGCMGFITGGNWVKSVWSFSVPFVQLPKIVSKLKIKKKTLTQLMRFQNISWRILFKWNQTWEFWFQPVFFRVNYFKVYKHFFTLDKLFIYFFCSVLVSPDTFYPLSFGKVIFWLTKAKACNISINVHFALTQAASVGACLKILIRQMLKEENSEFLSSYKCRLHHKGYKKNKS